MGIYVHTKAWICLPAARDISLYPCFLIPFLAVICLNVTSKSSFACYENYFSLILSAGELGIIFLSYKLHLKELNTFPLVRPYLNFVCVLVLLSFHTSCFYFDVILVYLCIIMLVLFYLFWLFHVFIPIFSSSPSFLIVASYW